MLVSLFLDPTSLLLGGVVLLCLLWWLSTRRPPGLPPGPGPALPLLGHLHLVPKDPRAQFWTWRRQYGDVFSLYMGGKLVVVLASYSAIREALVNFAGVFSDRPHSFAVECILKNKGSTWKEQRKTAVEILRAMGMSKDVLAEKIHEEITHYIQAVRDCKGAAVNLSQVTQVSVSNNICSILFGKRFHYKDPTFVRYIEDVKRVLKLLAGTSILNVLPGVRYSPGDPFKVKEILKAIASLYGFIDEHLAQHQQTLEEEENEDSDFIYSYLHQIRKHKTYVNTSLNEANLQIMVEDLFIGGTETTSTALQWAMLFFIHHPQVQDKCFKEVSDVIGTHRLPTMRDKPDLTYLEATTMEVLRQGDIVPLSLPHATGQSVEFRGYIIPKDTMIIPFLNSALQDPEIWGDPENFRPERFIGPDGKLIRMEDFIPFSTGHRVCVGESLARMELFLYLATLIQHFRFLPAEEGQLPSLEGVFGLTYTPQPYRIRAVPRM